MKPSPHRRFLGFVGIATVVVVIFSVAVVGRIRSNRPAPETCSDPSAIQWIEVLDHSNIRTFPSSTLRSLPGTDDFRLMASNIHGMLLSPDGRYLATRGDAGLSMHDAETFEMIWEQPSKYSISNYSFSPDGSFIATGTSQSEAQRYANQNQLYSLITLWDVETGEMLHEFDALISDISWSVDGEYIALVTGIDFHDQLTIYNTHTGESVYVFDAASRYNTWSPDGTKFAFGASDGRVAIRNVADETLAQTLPAPTSNRRKAQPSQVSSLCWSPDGKYIGGSVTILYEPIIDMRFWPEGPPYVEVLVIWDAATGQIVFSEEGDDFVEWSPGGSRFRSSSWETQSVWSVDPIKRLCSYKTYEDGIYKHISTQWTEDEILLAYEKPFPREDWNSVFIIDEETLVTVEQRDFGWINGLSWSPNGKKLATIVDDTVVGENVVLIWDMVTGNQESELEGATGLVDHVVEWSPDGTIFATTFTEAEVGNNTTEVDWTYSTYLWDVETQRQLQKIEDLHGDIRWSPDGNLLAGISPDGDIVLWDVEVESVFDTIPCNCIGLAWSPEGHSLAAIEAGGHTRIWNIETGECTDDIPLSGHTVTWSPDGKKLAVDSGGERNGTVHLWDLEQQEHIAQFDGPEYSASVTGMEWSPDGQLLAVTFYYNNRIFLLDTGTGELIHTFEEQVGSIVSLDWSPDGGVLASGSNSGELLLIDMSEWIEDQ